MMLNTDCWNAARRLSRAASLIVCFGLANSLYGQQETASPQDRVEVRSYEFKQAGKEIEYTVFVPTRYDAAKKTPLVVLLHGLGSNPRQVIRYQGLLAQAEEHGYIIVAPYGYNRRGWYGSRGHGNKFPRSFRQARDAPINEPENLGELS